MDRGKPLRQTIAALVLMSTLPVQTVWARADKHDLDVASGLVREGQWAEAERLLRDVLADIDGNRLPKKHLLRCLNLLAEAHVHQSQHADALAIALRYDALLDKSPVTSGAALRQLRLKSALRLVDTCTALARYDDAERHLAGATKLLPQGEATRPLLELPLATRAARLADSRSAKQASQQRWTGVRSLAARCLARIDAGDIDESQLPMVLAAQTDAHVALAQLDEAIVAQQRLYEHFKSHGHTKNAIGVLVAIARLYIDAGDTVQAIRYLKGSLQAEIRHHGKTPDAAEIQLALAKLYRQQRRYDDARQAAQGAAEIYEQLLEKPAELANRTRYLERLVTAYGQLGQEDKSIEFMQRVCQSYAESLGPRHATTLSKKLNLATLQVAAGQIDEARRQFNEVLEAVRDEPQLADVHMRVLRNLGALESQEGQVALAEEHFDEAIRLAEEHFGDADLQQGYAYYNLAAVVSRQGNYARAADLYERALRIFRSQQGARAFEIDTLLKIGMAYKSQGRIEPAIKYAELALEANKQEYGADAPQQIAIHNALGVLNLGIRRDRLAKLHCQRAVQLCRLHKMDDQPIAASVLYVQGIIDYLYQNTDAAEAAWIEAAKIQEDRNPILLPRTLLWLGKSAWTAGEADRAEQYLRKAYERQSEIHAYPVRTYLIACLLAEILDAKGQPREAQELLTEVVDILEVPRIGTIGSEVERAANFARFARAYDMLVEWNLRDRRVEEAIQNGERARNRTFLDQLSLDGIDLRKSLQGERGQQLVQLEQQLNRQLAALRNEYLAEIKRNQKSNKTAELSGRLARVQRQWVDAWKQIRNASPLYREKLLAGPDQQFTLKPVLEYLRGTNQLLLFYLLGSDAGHLVILGDPQHPLHLIRLETSESIGDIINVPAGPLTRVAAKTIVEEYMKDLRTPGGGRGLGGEVYLPEVVPAAKAGVILSNLILPAAARQIIMDAAPRGVVIVPDGALHQLPFEALMTDYRPGKTTYVLDVLPPISYAPSLAILNNLVLRTTEDDSDPQKFSVLTVGPEYPGNLVASENVLDRAAFLGGRLPKLTANVSECGRVATAFENRDVDVIRLVGNDATERQVRAQLAGRFILHMAAHGLVDQEYDNCFGSIALTLPKDKIQSSEDDGFFEQREIQSLPLNDCQLAVLSACQTVVGPNRPQEAGTSLAQAFLIAGAHRVVCSHWNVNDEATAEMIGTFMERIAQGTSKDGQVDYARALHEARLHLRTQKQWSSPRYWAPFVLVGPAQSAHVGENDGDDSSSDTGSVSVTAAQESMSRSGSATDRAGPGTGNVTTLERGDSAEMQHAFTGQTSKVNDATAPESTGGSWYTWMILLSLATVVTGGGVLFWLKRK